MGTSWQQVIRILLEKIGVEGDSGGRVGQGDQTTSNISHQLCAYGEEWQGVPLRVCLRMQPLVTGQNITAVTIEKMSPVVD